MSRDWIMRVKGFVIGGLIWWTIIHHIEINKLHAELDKLKHACQQVEVK